MGFGPHLELYIIFHVYPVNQQNLNWELISSLLSSHDVNETMEETITMLAKVTALNYQEEFGLLLFMDAVQETQWKFP
jgi:hypothetical protein